MSGFCETKPHIYFNFRVFVSGKSCIFALMSNKQPKKSKPSFTDLANTSPYLKEALKHNRNAFNRFFANNKHLLSKVNRSVYRQLKDITELSGFSISKEVYYGLRVGKRDTCSTAIVYVIANYWEMPGEKMLYEDLTQDDSIIQSKVA